MQIRNIKIASPCSANWDEMEGNERSRHCKQCKLSVHNLSAMSASEAEALLAGKQGRLCVRFYRRHDGTVLTQDCPAGLAKVKSRARTQALWLRAAFASAMVGFVPFWSGWLKWLEPGNVSKACADPSASKSPRSGWETGDYSE